MADERAYRISIRFNSGAETFSARVPELGLEATGASRAEAIGAIEAAIEARLQDAAAGESLPAPVDLKPVATEYTLQLSEALARELAYHAAASNLSPVALAQELIARALGQLENGRRRPAAGSAPERGNEAERPGDDRGNRNNNNNNRGPNPNRRQREGYRPELEDKSNFLEYLRNLEKNPGNRRR